MNPVRAAFHFIKLPMRPMFLDEAWPRICHIPV
jgi:hypothetical protein